MHEVLKGFREFLLKGDLISVAVGLVMALATYGVVTALVEGLIMPIVAALFGEPNFNSLSFTINGSEFAYGSFVTAVVQFVFTAIAIYFFVVVPFQAYQRVRGVSDDTRACPECTTTISVDARRCPSCTAPVPPTVSA